MSKNALFDILHGTGKSSSENQIEDDRIDLTGNQAHAGKEPALRGGLGALPDEIIFRVAKQIANALCYLHKQNILHCNLSSKVIVVCSSSNENYDSHPQQNLHDGIEASGAQAGVNSDWRVKLADFTLSKHATANNNVLQGLEPVQQCVDYSDLYKGDLNWSAPETLRDEPHTKASDVFSFGMILYEMITGEVPHGRRSAAQITGVVGYFGDKLKAPGSCSKELRHLVNNCLLFDAERRPTFLDIVKHLDKVEAQPRPGQRNPYIGNLRDFLS